MSGGPDPEGVLGVVAEGWEGVRGAELLRERLPREDALVVADQAFAPYARRRPDDVRRRVAELADGLVGEGAKALLLAGGAGSFEARPAIADRPVRGLEEGLRRAIAEARGGVVACAYASAEVRTMALASAIRGLRGGGSVVLLERGDDDVEGLLGRVGRQAPGAAVLLLLTPAAFADVAPVRAASSLAVVDALEAAADRLADDVRRRHLLARHGLRGGRITTLATRGGTTGFGRPPLSTAAALRRR